MKFDTEALNISCFKALTRYKTTFSYAKTIVPYLNLSALKIPFDYREISMYVCVICEKKERKRERKRDERKRIFQYILISGFLCIIILYSFNCKLNVFSSVYNVLAIE